MMFLHWVLGGRDERSLDVVTVAVAVILYDNDNGDADKNVFGKEVITFLFLWKKSKLRDVIIAKDYLTV